MHQRLRFDDSSEDDTELHPLGVLPINTSSQPRDVLSLQKVHNLSVM